MLFLVFMAVVAAVLAYWWRRGVIAHPTMKERRRTVRFVGFIALSVLIAGGLLWLFFSPSAADHDRTARKQELQLIFEKEKAGPYVELRFNDRDDLATYQTESGGQVSTWVAGWCNGSWVIGEATVEQERARAEGTFFEKYEVGSVCRTI